MWVKPAIADQQVRDPRTKRLLDTDVGTLVDDHDIVFAQLLSHGDVVRCEEDGTVLPDPNAPAPAQAEPASLEPAPDAAPASAKAAKVSPPAPDAPALTDASVVDPAAAPAAGAQ